MKLRLRPIPVVFASQWLGSIGVRPQASCVLDPAKPAKPGSEPYFLPVEANSSTSST